MTSYLMTACCILGMFTVAFPAILIAVVVNILTKYKIDRSLVELIAVFTILIIAAELFVMSVVFAEVYYHLTMGTPWNLPLLTQPWK
jgi:hypothetical protein